jgi:hypothetical protein
MIVRICSACAHAPACGHALGFVHLRVQARVLACACKRAHACDCLCLCAQVVSCIDYAFLFVLCVQESWQLLSSDWVGVRKGAGTAGEGG